MFVSILSELCAKFTTKLADKNPVQVKVKVEAAPAYKLPDTELKTARVVAIFFQDVPSE